MDSVFVSLLEHKGKTNPVLRALRNYIRRRLKEISNKKEYLECRAGLLERNKQLRGVSRFIKEFLKFHDEYPGLIQWRWTKQKKQLVLLKDALATLYSQSTILEDKLLGDDSRELKSLLLPNSAESKNSSILRLATLHDLKKLSLLCKQKAQHAPHPHCLSLTDLSQQDQEWLQQLIWVKRIQKSRFAGHDGKFKYPEEGLVSCTQFNRSSNECAEGLHATFFANEHNFREWGDLLLFLRIPIVVDEKSNLVVSVANPGFLNTMWKFRAKHFTVVGDIHWNSLCEKYLPGAVFPDDAASEEEEEADEEDDEEEEEE
jgi:hypothetical protein